jgi:hypothetical protein
MDLKTQAQGLVLIERPYVDLPTSLLRNMHKNLSSLLTEEIEGLSQVFIEITKAAWKMEQEAIVRELILRN